MASFPYVLLASPRPDDKGVWGQGQPRGLILDELDGRLDQGPGGVAVVVSEGSTTLDPALVDVIGPTGEELTGVASWRFLKEDFVLLSCTAISNLIFVPDIN